MTTTYKNSLSTLDLTSTSITRNHKNSLYNVKNCFKAIFTLILVVMGSLTGYSQTVAMSSEKTRFNTEENQIISDGLPMTGLNDKQVDFSSSDTTSLTTKSTVVRSKTDDFDINTEIASFLNNTLIQIGNEADETNLLNSAVKVSQLQLILPLVSGLIPEYESIYQRYIDANPNLFSSPALASEVQDMVNAIGADRKAPVEPFVTTNVDSKGIVSVSGIAEFGSTVTIIFSDGTTKTAIADNTNGKFGPIASTYYPQISGAVSITSTDVALNVSQQIHQMIEIANQD
jgi:hypothetical protein